jgi:hypothetical protein
MSKTRLPFLIPCLILFSFLLSYTYLFFDQIEHFTIQNHAPAIKLASIIPLFLLFFLLVLGAWMGYSGLISRLAKLDRKAFLHRDFITYLPLLFLALVPVLPAFYLDSNDLRARAVIFLSSILLAILYLKAAVLYDIHQKKESTLRHFGKKISTLPLNKKLVILFFISLVLYNAGSVLLTSSGQTFAGDEPHYLLISQSLLKDGDVDLSNNYTNRDYQKTMMADVKIRSHTAPGTAQKYSFHSPGISILLLPFYALGNIFHGKLLVFFIRLGMSVFGALLGLQIYLFCLQEWRKEKLALWIWFLYGFSSPVFFYSLHVYPEIIIALFSLIIFRLLRFSPSLSKSKLVFIGLLMSCFIWFHAIKYIFIVIPLFIYSVWTLLNKFKTGWNTLYFFLFPTLLTSLYFLFQYTFYGSFSLAAVSWRGAMAPDESLEYIKTIVTEIPFRYRLETLAGYFFDQRDGLLFYAPVYFFAFLGCVEMVRRNFRYFLVLLFLVSPYVLNSAFLTQRTGYAPQARPIVAISWALAIAIGYFLAYNGRKIFRILFYIFTLTGTCFVFLLLKNPLALYQLTTVGVSERFGALFLRLSHLHFLLPQYLPSYLKIVLVFFWLALYPRTVLMYPQNTTYPTGEKITYYSLGRVAKMPEPGKFQLPRDNRAYVFHFTSWQKIKELHVDFGSIEGVFDVDLQLFDKVLFKGKTSHNIQRLRLSDPDFYRYKNTHLYRLSIELRRESGAIAFSKPYLFSIQPVT